MNEKKAKALRKSMRFHPAAPREYQVDGRTKRRYVFGFRMPMFEHQGTVVSVGPRRRYQDAKRSQA